MSDIVERLKQVSNLRPGDPLPDDLGPNDWGVTISKLCADAANEIKRLRTTIEQIRSVAGAISIDELTFVQIKEDARA